MSGFGSTIPKTQKRLRLSWIVHDPHNDLSTREAVWACQNYRRVVSIDPGKVNLCIRIEKRPTDPNDINIETEVYVKVDLGGTMDPNNHKDMTFNKIRIVLDGYIDYFHRSHYILIENQLDINTKCVVVQTLIIAYFEMMLKNTPYLPLILSIDPKLKTKQLGCPPNLNKNGIKIWAVKEARRILTCRQDHKGLNILNKADKNKKADDYGDVVCQAEALFKLFNLPITPLTGATGDTEHNISQVSIQARQNAKDNQRGKSPTVSATLNEFMENDKSHNLGNFKFTNNAYTPDEPLTNKPLKINLKYSNQGNQGNPGVNNIRINIKNGSSAADRSSTYGLNYSANNTSPRSITSTTQSTTPVRGYRKTRVRIVPRELVGNKNDFKRRIARRNARNSQPTTPVAKEIEEIDVYNEEDWSDDLISISDPDDSDDEIDIYAGLI